MKKIINSRAQITVFLVIAVLLVGIIIVFISYNTKKSEVKTPEIDPNLVPIKSFVENCLKETGENAIEYTSYSGGYYNSPNLSTKDDVAYYFYSGKNLMPDKQKVESELSEYMNNMISVCTKDFDSFSNYNISEGKIKTSSKIEENQVVFNVLYPISIQKDKDSYKLEEFSNIEIPSRLSLVYNTAKEMTEEQMFNQKEVCMSCFLRLSLENDLRINLNDIDNKTILFTITDPKSKINGQEFKYNFANKYA